MSGCIGALLYKTYSESKCKHQPFAFAQYGSSAVIPLQITPCNRVLSGLAAAASFVSEQLVVNRCPANGFGQLTTDDDVLLIGAVFVTSIGDVVH